MIRITEHHTKQEAADDRTNVYNIQNHKKTQSGWISEMQIIHRPPSGWISETQFIHSPPAGWISETQFIHPAVAGWISKTQFIHLWCFTPLLHSSPAPTVVFMIFTNIIVHVTCPRHIHKCYTARIVRIYPATIHYIPLSCAWPHPYTGGTNTTQTHRKIYIRSYIIRYHHILFWKHGAVQWCTVLFNSM